MPMFKEAPEWLVRHLAQAGLDSQGRPLGEIALTVGEKDFQRAVIKMAEENLWLVYHPWLSVKSKAGFPDLTCLRGRRLVFAELKAESGTPSAAQLTWGEALAVVGGHVEHYFWRPSNWSQIMDILK